MLRITFFALFNLAAASAQEIIHCGAPVSAHQIDTKIDGNFRFPSLQVESTGGHPRKPQLVLRVTL